jgi:hypothetical protein
MFAVLTFERDPLRLADLPGAVETWVQSAGGYAMFGILLWLLFGLPFLRASDRDRAPGWQKTLFGLFALAALAGYLVLLTLRAPDIKTAFAPPPDRALGQAPPQLPPLSPRERFLLTGAGVCALLAVGTLFLRGLLALRWRRIYALAKLSFKEALRRRVLYAFSALLLVFLFATWFVPYKPEDQVRIYVQVLYWAMTPLLLFTAAFLAGFSIPTDIRQLTIHTVVTKPVEKFEIVLGRFLGFMALMTLVLAVMTALSLGYVLRGVGPDAAAESLKARVPVYGNLFFENTEFKEHGDSVGREWDYRSYIAAPGPGQEPQRACWGFEPLTGSALNRDKVRCEFNFDIYRTTKGEENKGIACLFTFFAGPYDRARATAFREARGREKNRPDAPPDAVLDAKLAEEFGFFEVPSKSITDFHIQTIDVPVALFRYAVEKVPPQPASLDSKDLPIQVRVSCVSRTQYIGMAKYDLYFRQDDPEAGADTTLFALNFFKGALGLWLLIGLVTGVAVCVSTYLTGVISMLLALLLLLAGTSRDFIRQVAYGTNIGGGPTEAFLRLVSNQHITAPLDENTSITVASKADLGFRFLIRRVLDVIPDVERFDMTSFVAEGFNISAAQIGLDVLLLLGYLLPWFVLAYFIMKWREIATW